MKVLRFIYLSAAAAYYKRAMREINPTHDDVPTILMKQQAIEDETRRMFA